MTGNRVTIRQGLIEIVADTTIDATFYAPSESWSLPPTNSVPTLVLAIEKPNQMGMTGVRVTLPGILPGTSGTIWSLESTMYQGSEPVPLVWSSEVIGETLNNLYIPPPISHCYFRLVAEEPGKLPVRYPAQTINTLADTTQDEIAAILSDNWITRGAEKTTLQNDWSIATAEHTTLLGQSAIVFKNTSGAGGVALEAVPYNTAYLALAAVAAYWADSTIDTDVSGASPSVSTLWTTYYSSRAALTHAITSKVNTTASTSAGTATWDSSAGHSRIKRTSVIF